MRNQNLTFGADYKLGSVDGVDTYYTSTDIISNAGKMQTGSVFMQDEIFLLNRKLQVNLGLRYDFSKYYDGLFTIDYPSYSIEFISRLKTPQCLRNTGMHFVRGFRCSINSTESNRIYLSVARGFRAPILDDMTRTGKKKGNF